MPELNIQLTPSRQLAAFIAASHTLAAIATWFSASPWWLSLATNTAIAASFLWHWHHHYRTGHRQLSYHNHQWHLISETAEETLNLTGESLVTPWLVVLRFQTQAGKTRSLVLPPDSAPTDDLRRLRVLLRFGLQFTNQQ